MLRRAATVVMKTEDDVAWTGRSCRIGLYGVLCRRFDLGTAFDCRHGRARGHGPRPCDERRIDGDERLETGHLDVGESEQPRK